MFSVGDSPSGNDARTWMGLRFQSEDDRRTVSKVILAAIIMAVFQCINFLLKVFASNKSPQLFEAAFVGLLIGMLLPACGYFGAKHSNRQLMGCFCGGSWCNVCMMALLVIVIVWSWIALKNDGIDPCNEACIMSVHPEVMEVSKDGRVHVEPASASAVGGPNSQNTFSVEEVDVNCSKMGRNFAKKNHIGQNVQDLKKECQEDFARDESFVSTAFTFILLLTIPNCMLASFAGYHGLQLWNRLGDGEFIVQEPLLDPDRLEMSATTAQPEREDSIE